MGPGMPQNAPNSATPEGVPNEMSPTDPKTPNTSEPTAATSPSPPMQAVEQAEPQSPAISEFLKNMETSNLTDSDTLEVSDQEEELHVEAQMAIPPMDEPLTDKPAPAPLNPRTPPTIKAPEEINAPAPVANEEPLEVMEGEVSPPKQDETVPEVSEFDKKVDQAFADVSIADVVAKLEDLAKIFQVREISRQLAVVDMMLDSLGLASLFPSLQEAMSRSMESNGYILTRLEDILARLRGTMDAANAVALKGSPSPNRPEIDAVRNKLTQDAEKEKQRKQQRKEQQAAEFNAPAGNKPTPRVNVVEDMGQPLAPAPRA